MVLATRISKQSSCLCITITNLCPLYSPQAKYTHSNFSPIPKLLLLLSWLWSSQLFSLSISDSQCPCPRRSIPKSPKKTRDSWITGFNLIAFFRFKLLLHRKTICNKLCKVVSSDWRRWLQLPVIIYIEPNSPPIDAIVNRACAKTWAFILVRLKVWFKHAHMP